MRPLLGQRKRKCGVRQAVETASQPSVYVITGIKAGVNERKERCSGQFLALRDLSAVEYGAAATAVLSLTRAVSIWWGLRKAQLGSSILINTGFQAGELSSRWTSAVLTAYD